MPSTLTSTSFFSGLINTSSSTLSAVEILSSTPASASDFTFSVVSAALQNQGLAALASVAVTLGLRLSAIKWKMSLPLYISHEGDDR